MTRRIAPILSASFPDFHFFCGFGFIRTSAPIRRLVESMSDGRFIIGTGLRGKVERLLHGDVNAADLHDLFFTMRDEAVGSGLVTEIANFIAHPTRTQGPIRQDVADASAILCLHLTTRANPILTNDMPVSVHNALRANLRRVRKTALKTFTGMNRTQVESVLERILARSIPTATGRVSKLDVRSEEERKVVECVARFIKGGSQFTDADLFEDFCRALQNQKLLKVSEKKTLRQAKPAVTLFALTVLHNKKLDLGDGSIVPIAIAPDMRHNLGAFAFSEVGKDYGRGKTTAAIWIFETQLAVEKYCDAYSAPAARAPFIGDFELEKTSKLGRPS